MADTVSDLAQRLADNAEAVCRHYLSNGRRAGRYWMVGDVQNTPGRSLYVRLAGRTAGAGAAGHWTDAATGEHGDLVDLIQAACGFEAVGKAMDEARRFLGIAQSCGQAPCPAPLGSPDAARRLFAMAQPIRGTLAERYLASRGISLTAGVTALRFHPRCWYRRGPDDPPQTPDAFPALIAVLTDVDGAVTGVQRTWLDPSDAGKARVATPRRALGEVLGNAVRFGRADAVMAVGEGIETVLSLRSVLPRLPLAAALSATHLAAIRLPPSVRRLYIVRDNDHAGQGAAANLAARAEQAGVQCLTLTPRTSDFNDDLQQLGGCAIVAALRTQLAPEDVCQLRRQTWTDSRSGLASELDLRQPPERAA
ncbi:MAG: DUF7146 domain-containing protein [Thermohalobaculum sp.]